MYNYSKNVDELNSKENSTCRSKTRPALKTHSILNNPLFSYQYFLIKAGAKIKRLIQISKIKKEYFSRFLYLFQ